jgi:two-component system NarL family sensor kinase
VKADRNKLFISLSYWIALAVLLGVAVMTHQNTLRLLGIESRAIATELTDPDQAQALRLRAHLETALFVVGTVLSVATLVAVFFVLKNQIAARKLAEQSLIEEQARLERQSRRQAALAEIELAINGPHELQPVLERIVERVTELLPASGASVILWDAASQDFVVSTTTVPQQPGHTTSQRVRRSSGATRWIVDHKTPLIVRDIRDDPFGANPMLKEFGLQSYVGVPLIADGTALGVLYALDRQVRDYPALEIDFLTVLAGRAALAVERVRQFDELQGLNEELERRVQQRTAELEQVNAALSRSQELLQSAIDGLSAHIAILDEQSTIIAVNLAWREFADQNRFRGHDHGIGMNYLAVCDHARGLGAEPAAEVAQGLRAILNNTRAEFRFEYQCHSATEERWFQLRISRLPQSRPMRLAVAHENVTEIKRSQEALRVLSGRLMQLQDEERRNIARELHDATGQNLGALALNLARLQKLLPQLDGQSKVIASESLALAEQCQREIRTLSYLLHPPMLDEAGLIHALQWYADGFARRSGIPVDVIALPELGRLPADAERTLFRIVQEGLSNIHRHANCTRASVQVIRQERQVALEIKDNGRGMPIDPTDIGRLGVGIMGMRERVHQLGGRLEFETGPHGTLLRALIPLQRN